MKQKKQKKIEQRINEEFEKKYTEYTNRSLFWTDKTQSQIGYSINLFTTIGVASLGYLISNRDKFPKLYLDCNSPLNGVLVLYFCALFTILLSVGAGIISVLSRLYDYRLTRHIVLSRKRFLAKKKDLIKSKEIDITRESHWKCFKKTVFGNINFIVEDDYNSTETLLKKFDDLRKDSKILGNITWNMHKNQIILFVCGSLLYGFTIFK